MINKIYHLLERPLAVVAVLGIATLLSMVDRNIGFFFGLGVVLFLTYKKNWQWSAFGFGEKITLKTILISLVISLLLYGMESMIDAILQHYFGYFELSSLDDIKGDLLNYIIIMIIMWVFAAFGEELLFRGYYMQRLAMLFGGSRKAWIFSALLVSIYFGLSHAYQGTAGIIAVSISSLFFSILYYKNKNNLAIAALVHGFTDTIGLTLIYFNQYKAFSIWLIEALNL